MTVLKTKTEYRRKNERLANCGVRGQNMNSITYIIEGDRILITLIISNTFTYFFFCDLTSLRCDFQSANKINFWPIALQGNENTRPSGIIQKIY